MAMRLTEAPQVEAGQDFVIDRFRPEDAVGVAGLFLSVYGDGYHVKHYYDPEWLAAANASNEVVSIVARTTKGDIVSHMAAYRSAAVNPKLYEAGLGLTLAPYRGREANGGIAARLIETLPSLGLAGLYGEPVCNHTGMQKISYILGLHYSAVEVDLMPAEAYAAEKSAEGRVSCLFNFRAVIEAPQTLYVPAVHMEDFRFILEDMPQNRTMAPASLFPQRAESRISSKIFDFASVSRCQLMACGEDIAAALEGVEREADAKSCTTRQVFLALADPGVGLAAQLLRAKGYFLGGLVPRWFEDGDGLLLQRLLHSPGFSQMKIHDGRAREIVTRVEADWRAVSGTA
jgi:hypothetical protein